MFCRFLLTSAPELSAALARASSSDLLLSSALVLSLSAALRAGLGAGPVAAVAGRSCAGAMRAADEDALDTADVDGVGNCRRRKAVMSCALPSTAAAELSRAFARASSSSALPLSSVVALGYHIFEPSH